MSTPVSPLPLLRRSAGLLLLIIAFLGTGILPASAHVRDSTGYSRVTADGPSVSYDLSLEYAMLARAVDLGPDAVSASDETRQKAALTAGRGNLEAYLADRITLFLDGAACQPDLAGTDIKNRDGVPYAELKLEYSCGASAGSYLIKYGVFRETDAVADDHSNIVNYRLGGVEGQAVLDGSNAELAVGEGSAARAAARFAAMGVEHILSGLDHVLFVVALALGAANVRSLLGVVSMFTLAHSITLISALLGWIRLPAEVVEPLIALSIAFVAAENLLGATRRRLPAVFVFGLLHGLGFAGSLRVTDEFSWSLVTSLLSFNIGIEAGQAFLLLAAFPLILLARRLRWSVPVLRGATATVAAVGLFWFIERFLLA
ncbi:HupE/UreJ family protein [Pseudarthrobacter sp. NPDC092439]|uniref:HupE/UreJ family protein n=1 Tax=unclassified Pseudarthrobacter TaxID=2647000 RepID=UPI0037FEBC8A